MKIKFHTFYLYAFLVITSYGFYGAGAESIKNILQSTSLIIYFLLPIIIFLFFINEWFFKLNNNLITFSLPNLKISKHKIFTIFAISTFLFILSSNYMLLSVTNDGLYYSSNAIVHMLKISEMIVSKTDIFEEVQMKVLIRFIGLIIIVCALLFIFMLYKFKNFSNIAQVLFFLFILIFLRTMVSFLGGVTNPHPPLMGLPILITTVVFGLNDLSLKLSYFIPFLCFVYFIYVNIKYLTTKLNALFICIAIASIPGVLFLGSTVEQSLWSMICFSVVLLLLLNDQNIKYRNIFIIILFFSFMRSASIFAIFPVIFHALFIAKKNILFKKKLKNLIKDAAPMLLFLPFFLYASIEAAEITTERITPIDGLKKIFLDGGILINPLDTFGLLFCTIFLLLLLFNLKNRYGFMGVSFLLFLILIYNFIDTSGSAKYQLEIYIPILLFSILLFLKTYKKIPTLIPGLIGVLIIFINISTIHNFEKFCINKGDPFNSSTGTYDLNFGCNFITHTPFKLDDAYDVIRDKNGFKSLYMPGVYYESILSPIMSNISVREWRAMDELLSNQSKINYKNKISWISGDAKLIDQNKEINYIILGETQDYQKIYKELIEIGWSSILKTKESKFGTQVFVLSRN